MPGLVERVGEMLRDLSGQGRDHVVRPLADSRLCPAYARAFRRGLTAWGTATQEIEAHFSMLAHGIDFVSYAVDHLPNPFVTFVRDRLGMPVISWTVRDEAAVELTFAHADQMTFEGFEPEQIRWPERECALAATA